MRSQLVPDRDRDVFAEFDRAYGVANWTTPDRRMRRPKRRDPSIPADAPDWWTGDEDASQTFLATMGVKL